MGFKLPMDGFKKVSEDKHKTVLRHDNGHELSIAHGSLSKKMKDQLKSLPMANGGNPKLEESHKEPSHKKSYMAEGGNPSLEESHKHDIAPYMNNGAASQSMPMTKQIANRDMKYADGGNVPAKPAPKPNPKDQEEKQDDYQVGEEGSVGNKITKAAQGAISNLVHLADGGEVPAQEPSMTDNVMSGLSGMGTMIGHAVQSAVSGLMGNNTQTAEPQAQAIPAPVQASPEMTQAQQALQQAAQPSNPISMNQHAANNAASPDISPVAAYEPNEKIAGVSDANQPGLEEGYKNQVLGEQNQAKALVAQGARDAENFQATAKQEGDLLTQFQDHSNNMNTEIQNFMQDIQNDHIDPKHLWDNKSGLEKAKVGIGFILSGMGSGLTGQPNMAAEMLNRNIDRDIDAQKANLGKKENLLGAMFKQYGNMRDATDMTHILMNAHNIDMIKASAARAQSPLAKASAQQAIGKLQEQIAPVMYQMNMRRTLQGINMGGNGSNGQSPSLSHVDPSTFLNMIPETAVREKAATEIERAQNTRRMSQPIMQAFDKASNDMTGLGRAEALIKTPRSLNAMNGLLNTTVTDLTGTARQAEFDNVKHNFNPSPYDTASDTAQKRQALQEYLEAKRSAPIAKANGIDLDKFESTNLTPYNRLNPQQQKFADWAQANPNNPKAQMVLKKLGLK